MAPEKFTLVTTLCLALAAPSLGAASGDHDRGDKGPKMSFETLDVDGNGEISLEDMQEMAKTRFAMTDADQDGFVTVEELTAHREANMGNKGAKRVNRMFSKMDKDGDGKLTFEELTAKMSSGKLIERLDQDGNGTVSAEEFAAKSKGHGWGRGKNHGDDHNCDDKDA